MAHHGNRWGIITLQRSRKEKRMKHKRPRKPTREQKVKIKAAGYVPENWNVLYEDNISMMIVNKESGRRKVILC